MKTTTVPFDLRAWRMRMRWTQKEAAEAVGLSLAGYCHAEYRAQDREGAPCNATLAKLAMLLEEKAEAEYSTPDVYPAEDN